MRVDRVLLIAGVTLAICWVAVGALTVGISLIWPDRQQSPTYPSDEIGPYPLQEATGQIVIAYQDLPSGVLITAEMTRGEAPAVGLREWPEEAIPQGAITKIENVYGRTTRVEIIRDLPIFDSMFHPQIVVAAQDLPRDTIISEDMIWGEAPVIVLRSWPQEEIPDGAIMRLQDVYSRTTRVDITRDMPILENLLIK